MAMLLMTVVMAVLDENYDCGFADGDCDGADEVGDCIADDEDNGDDGHVRIPLRSRLYPSIPYVMEVTSYPL